MTMKFELGLWYIAIYPNGRRLRFQFIGGEPPMVETEDGRRLTLEEVINGCTEVIPA